MHIVLTLVAAADAAAALPGLAAAIAGELAIAGSPSWLAPGEACDLFVAAADPLALEQRVRGIIGKARVDLVVQPACGRRKRLLVADLEATMIENEMLEELADFLGQRARMAEITRRAMNGEIDFAAALETRVALLRGLPQAALERAAARIRLTAGAGALVATMRRHGARTLLVSGGFTIFAERVAAMLGFERILANRLELGGGRVLGTLGRPIVDAAAKRDALVAAAAEHAIPRALTLAVGDGANDLAMLAAAGLGIAFRPKPAVAAAARSRIAHADLRAVLYVQGYRRDEILETGQL